MERSSRMKHWVNRFGFSLRVAWRNMRIHPLRTILLMIGFLGVSMTILLVTTMTDIFYTYFYGDLVDTYQDIDLKITVKEGSDTRFFSVTPLGQSDIDESTEGIYPFFEYDALVDVSESDKDYVHVYASSVDMLYHLSDDENVTVTALADDEVMITASYANHHQLELRDQVTLRAKGQEKAFTIVAILEDGKLFKGDSIFIDKQASLTFFLSALDPSLADLPSILLKNIYNVLYVDVKEDISVDDAISTFKGINGYASLDYQETIDIISVNQLVDRNTALLSGLLSFVFVAIMLVLQTTLKYFFLDRKSQSTMIHILGGEKSYALSILGIEVLIEQIISFILAVILTNVSIRFGMNYLEAAEIYQITWPKIGITFGIVCIIFIGMFLYNDYQMKHSTDIQMLRINKDEKKFNWKWQLTFVCMSLVIYGVLYIPTIAMWLGHYASVIRIMLSGIFLLSMAPLVFYGVMMVSSRYREKKRLYYHLRIMTARKGFAHYFSMTLIVSLVIFLLVFMMQHLDQRIKTISQEYDIDFIVTRMLSDEDQIHQEILSNDLVEDADRADVYSDVKVNDKNLSINFVISMRLSETDTYFNIPDLEEQMASLSLKAEPAIILPIGYQEIYHYKINDMIYLTLNPEDPNQAFIITGFFQKQGMSLAFTNLYQVDVNVKTHANSILVNATDDVSALKHVLLEDYSDQMIIVFDFYHDYLHDYILSMERVKNFIIGYLSLVMVCFIMTLANHQTMMQIEREVDDARMLSIGYDMKMIQKETVYEGFIVMLVSLVVSILAYLLIITQIEGFFAVFGAFEIVTFKPISIVIGSAIYMFIFSIMWLMRLIRQPHIKVIDYTRTFE